jgi:D-inositol-3-phosphate glycosyltransferase
VLSVHTSPLEQPGAHDAGGLNVYVIETARRLARRGVRVDVFTGSTPSGDPAVVKLEPGLRVLNIAMPARPDNPDELAQMLERFGARLLEQTDDPGPLIGDGRCSAHLVYDVIHSHYWMSGQVGRLASRRWDVPLVHSAHTLAKVKNLRRSAAEQPEPPVRVAGEEEIVADADQLVAATEREAEELVRLYDADPAAISVVEPGVDLEGFRPIEMSKARAEFGFAGDEVILAFVGRIQPHKAPDLLIRAAAELAPSIPQLQVLIVGGVSGRTYRTGELASLVDELGLGEVVTFVPPQTRERLAVLMNAADVLVMPSRSESFGLAALEAQACGTPVVATPVGGLTKAVVDGESGLLAASHDPADVAAAIRRIVTDPALAARLSAGAVRHAARHSWDRTVDGLLDAYCAARDRRLARCVCGR